MIKIVQPPEPLVSLDEMKVALGESGDDRNDFIETLVMAAQGELDGPNGWVGISVAPQIAQITASAFDPAIRLIGGPVFGVTINYFDADGDAQTLSDTGYIVGADGTISLADGAEWPTLAERADAVTVTYDVGIDDGDDPRVALMRTAIILHVRMTMDMVDPAMSRKAIESIVRPMWVIP